MTFHAALADLFTELVSVEPWESQDEFGEPSYGASVSYPARIVHAMKLVRNDEGREVVSNARAFVNTGTTAISPKARVTLPDGTQPKILTVERFPDEAGEIATTIYFAG